MSYIKKLTLPSEIKDGEKVIFEFNDGSRYEGHVNVSSGGKYYIGFRDCRNDKIFDKLGLNRYEFVENLVGYKVYGGWPEVHSAEDLDKVLYALLKVNQPEEELVISKVEENQKVPSEWDWLFD